jgi:hypothetical protein
MSTAKERLVLLIPPTVVETGLIIYSRMTSERPTTIFLYALAIWNIFIWPFFVNPLRHLPTVHVFPLKVKVPIDEKC